MKSKKWDLKSRKTKYLVCLILLLREIARDRNVLVFAFQANIYCILICKLFGIKIITRSNTAPEGWSKNILKKYIYKFFLNNADQVMANSNDFVKSLKSEYHLRFFGAVSSENVLSETATTLKCSNCCSVLCLL